MTDKRKPEEKPAQPHDRKPDRIRESWEGIGELKPKPKPEDDRPPEDGDDRE